MEEFESTPEYQALVVAATVKPERRMGDSVIPAELPQWGEVRDLALKLMKTDGNQLGLHVYLIKAEANINGFNGFQESLENALVLMQDQWEHLFPGPDLDDPDDMYYARVNLINELSGQPMFLDSINKLPLVSVRGIGAFSTRDIDICAGSVPGSTEEQARCQEGLIRGAFAESDKVELQRVADALDSLPMLCHSVETVFAEKTGQQDVLSLDRLVSRIESCRNRYHEYADEFLVLPTEAEDPAARTTSVLIESPAVQSSLPVQTSSLNNRAMVLESFNAILRYYELYEPSSPVRILTYRTREFVDKPFFALLQSLAPACQDDLPSMLAQLQKQPLAALLSDSYTRYVSGEVLPVLGQADAPVNMTDDARGGEPNGTETPVDDSMQTTSASEATIDGISNVIINVTSSAAAGTPKGNNDNVLVIDSRHQVLEVMHDIETYFLNTEPSSPIPLVISDIRKLVSKRFVELIAEFSSLLPATSIETSE